MIPGIDIQPPIKLRIWRQQLLKSFGYIQRRLRLSYKLGNILFPFRYSLLSGKWQCYPCCLRFFPPSIRGARHIKSPSGLRWRRLRWLRRSTSGFTISRRLACPLRVHRGLLVLRCGLFCLRLSIFTSAKLTSEVRRDGINIHSFVFFSHYSVISVRVRSTASSIALSSSFSLFCCRLTISLCSCSNPS